MKHFIMAALAAGMLMVTAGTNRAEARRYYPGTGPYVRGSMRAYRRAYRNNYRPYYRNYYYGAPNYYGYGGYSPYGYYSVTPGVYGGNYYVSPYGFYLQF